ncbi:MAG: hypothetical protein KDC83_03150 [Flavobacteriales bacterium]|nr:hypothetical protein [Flavobacteriales bacterium]
MSQSLLNTIYLAGVFLLLFASAELLYHKFKVQAELTRKYVHFSTGILTLLFPPLINNHWLVLALCTSFLVILLTSIRFSLLPSINAVDRVTRGSMLYPIVVYSAYLTFSYFGHYAYYYIPILILAICDPIAALVGKRWPIGKYAIFGYSKTLTGSSAFFVSAVLLCGFLLVVFESISISSGIMISFAVGLTTTLAEAVTHRGFDNLTIPGIAIITLMCFQTHLT